MAGRELYEISIPPLCQTPIRGFRDPDVTDWREREKEDPLMNTFGILFGILFGIHPLWDLAMAPERKKKQKTFLT